MISRPPQRPLSSPTVFKKNVFVCLFSFLASNKNLYSFKHCLCCLKSFNDNIDLSLKRFREKKRIYPVIYVNCYFRECSWFQMLGLHSNILNKKSAKTLLPAFLNNFFVQRIFRC